MKNILVINIEWEKVNFEEILLKDYDTNIDYGLYQLYGHHPSYGENALLYIGQANDQTFAKRLRKRDEFIECSARPSFILLGRIVSSKNEPVEWGINNWSKIINLAEIMLIKAHMPSMNKKDATGLLGMEYCSPHYLIINWGDYGRILPEISTLRLSYTYWEYEDPISKEKLRAKI